MRGLDKSKGFLAFIIFLGAISGSLLGDLLGSRFEKLYFLKNIYSIGTSKPLSLDLKILTISLGINFNINLMSILGIILSIILYRNN
ncbi:protein of unknown function [Clostridium sp. USBA 49]|jgi:hypothetical protein|uniref:DUF4321 domain-containing protein n=1 Tax=Clostridium TaxID=1485 RepID=UPI00099ABB58|nr:MULTISPECIES: DUF4321 domain-containing protein [Clostridium]SKA75286.1 protein of unknown function [Clostridium sp. USBA 49]